MRKIFVAFFLASFFLFTGCDSAGSNDSSDNNAPSDNIAGTHSLKTIEGVALPYVVAQLLNDKVEITSGHIRINSNNTFSTSAIIKTTEAGVVSTVTVPESGDYTKTGTAMRFNYSDGTLDTGSISGSTITITSEGLIFVFKK